MDAIRELVERGLNVNAKTKMRANPLHHLFAKHFDSSTKVMNLVVTWKTRTLKPRPIVLDYVCMCVCNPHLSLAIMYTLPSLTGTA